LCFFFLFLNFFFSPPHYLIPLFFFFFFWKRASPSAVTFIMYFEWKYVVGSVAHTGTAGLRAVHQAPGCLNITGRQVLVCRYLYLEIHYMSEYICNLCTCTVKGKPIPLQAWTGPEGSRSLRLPDFKTVGT